jgi:O-antigen/teichoic acid export membrane protein
MEEKQVNRLRLSALFARLSRGRGPIALADQMMVSAANFAGGIVLVRGLGLEEFGKYSIAYSLLLFANALQMSFVASPMLNIGPMLTGEEKERFVNGMLTLQLSASVVLFAVFALVGLVARLFTAFYSVPCILLFACCIGTYQLQDWLRRYYFLVNKGKHALATDFMSYCVQFLLLLALWRMGRLTLLLTFLVMCITSVAAVVMGPVTDRLRPAWGTLGATWKRCRSLSRDLLISSQVRWFGTQGLFLIGAAVLGSAGIGGLRATQSVGGPIYLILMSFENVVPIRLAEELKTTGAAGTYALAKRWIVVSSLLFALAMVPIAVFGKVILKFLYGPALVAFYWPMLLQLATIVITAATMLWFHFYRTVQETRVMLQANGLAAVANLVTVYWFGRLWNASGIVLSILLGQAVIAVFCTLYWARHRTEILDRYPVPNLPMPAESLS